MASADELVGLGLRPGDRVRFRRGDSGRWNEGKAVGVERDGSLAIVDRKGASRAIALASIEVRAVGPRGAARWEPLPERVGRSEQLGLW
jgi:hypothetical protein